MALVVENNFGRERPQTASFREYVAIARLDHSTKHIFIVFGIVLAYMLRGVHVEAPLRSIALGLFAAVCIASANYVINEFLDREFDRFHPVKSQRSAVQSRMSGAIITVEWVALVIAGLGLALLASKLLFYACLLFALQGIAYNVRPFRTKDVTYFDVISESINNPIRLVIGWAMLDPNTLPPGSIILAYWFGGAFLMAAKRLSEYREIVANHGAELLCRYRASFKGYTEVSLNTSCMAYSLLAMAFVSIFLIKYRIEYIFTVPLIVTLFLVYYVMSMHPDSSAQKPEQLFKERGLIFVVVLLLAVFAIGSFVKLPFLHGLIEQYYIVIR